MGDDKLLIVRGALRRRHDFPEGFGRRRWDRRAIARKTRRVVTFTAAERYRYLYSGRELGPLVSTAETLSTQAARTTVLFNNCYANYGATNAREFIAQLGAG